MDSFHQNSSDPFLHSPSSSTIMPADEDVIQSLCEAREIQRLKEINAVWKFNCDEINAENAKLQNENNQLRSIISSMHYENIRMKEAMENQNDFFIQDDYKEALENENVNVNQRMAELMKTNAEFMKTNAELIKTNRKQLDKIFSLQTEKDADRKVLDDEKMMLETKIAEMEQQQYLTDLQPLVFKEIHKSIDGNEWAWYCYTTAYNECAEPTRITMNDSNDLIVNDFVSNRKLILDGTVSQFPYDDLNECIFPGYYCDSISRLLGKVQSCNITCLFLQCQSLSWNEYKQLVSSGMLETLHLSYVIIEDENKALVPIEKILTKVPNIEEIKIDFPVYSGLEEGSSCEINKKTFKTLVKLPSFSNLRKFVLGLNPDHCKRFDTNAFLDFMKTHENANFMLTFNSLNFDGKKNDKAVVEIMKYTLLSRAKPDQLDILII